MGRKVRVPNVDSNSYLYIDLLNDVVEKALHEMLGNVNLLLHMRYEIPGTDEYLNVNDDQFVVEMFKLHQSHVVINVQVFNMDIIPPEQSDNFLNRNPVNGHENLGIETIGRGKNVKIDDINYETEEYGYDFTSDDSWKQGWDSNNEDDLGDEH